MVVVCFDTIWSQSSSLELGSKTVENVVLDSQILPLVRIPYPYPEMYKY